MAKLHAILLVGFSSVALLNCVSHSSPRTKSAAKAKSGPSKGTALAQNSKTSSKAKTPKKVTPAKSAEEVPTLDAALAPDSSFETEPAATQTTTDLVSDPGLAPASFGDEEPAMKEDNEPIDGGKLTAANIKQILDKNVPTVKPCYVELLKREPKAAGTIKVAFTIDGKGAVINNTVTKDSTLADAIMQQCVLKKMSEWKFPEPFQNQEIDVTYPFVFQSANE